MNFSIDPWIYREGFPSCLSKSHSPVVELVKSVIGGWDRGEETPSLVQVQMWVWIGQLAGLIGMRSAHPMKRGR